MSRLRLLFGMSLCTLALAVVIGCGGKKDDSDSDSDSGSSSGSSSDSSSGGSGQLSSGGGSGGSGASSGTSGGTSAPAGKEAVIAFELNVARLMNSDVGKALPAEQALGALGPMGPGEAEALMSVKSVSGFLNAPKDMGTVMGFAMMGPSPGQPLPIDFLVTIEFTDADAASEPMSELMATTSETQLNGVTYRQPEGPGAPPILIRVDSDTKVTIGSKDYITSGSGLATADLQTRWNAMPESAVKLAVDMNGARNLLTEASAALRQEAPPMAMPFIDLIDKGSFASIVFDPSNDNMLSLAVEGNTAEDAEAIRTVFAGLLQMAQMMSASTISEMEADAPEFAGMAKELMGSLGAKVEGNRVSIDVPKPEGFDTALQQAMMAAQQAAQQTVGLNDFKQIALAVHNFHDARKRLPFSPADAGASADLSWRVLILPYLEENSLYEEFNVEEAWNSEQNASLADFMPFIYGEDGANATVVFIKTDPVVQSFSGVTDGLSNTIMCIETTNPVPWTQPIDISPEEALEMINGLAGDEQLRAMRYDGSTFFLPGGFSPDEIEAMLHPVDGR